MEKKSWKESYSELQRIVLPGDTNVFDSLYGGRLVEWIDNVASIVAMKHSRKRTVTGSIDNLFFSIANQDGLHSLHEGQDKFHHENNNGNRGRC